MRKIRRMFPGGNTANGFYSFHNNIIDENRNMLYILKGMPGGGKSSLMKEVGERALEKGYSVEYHHCPSDPNSIDGIVIIELKIAIVDGTAPHIIDPVYPGLKDKLIDLGTFIDSDKLAKNEEKIVESKLNNKIAYSRAYGYFKSAKIIYNIIIENNKRGMNFGKANEETIKLIEKIFIKSRKKAKESKIRHMFSAANTPDGYVDFTHTLLDGISKIYYIEGEIGTGKSTVLKKLMELGKIEGYNMEIYYNPTFPEKIETIIIEELNICITSNKNALKFLPEKINLNNYFDHEIKRDEDYRIYYSLIEEAIKNLSLAKENHKTLEEAYKFSIDFSGVNKIKKNIIREIFNP
ncbi:MAG: ATP-binding protein [Tissierellia bacterium]|nr:ATP-binding protein [Tissierellia bacterium]